jgi:hypothetical protein
VESVQKGEQVKSMAGSSQKAIFSSIDGGKGLSRRNERGADAKHSHWNALLIKRRRLRSRCFHVV